MDHVALPQSSFPLLILLTQFPTPAVIPWVNTDRKKKKSEKIKRRVDNHLSLLYTKCNSPVSPPTLQQTYYCGLASLLRPASSSSHRSSTPTFLCIPYYLSQSRASAEIPCKPESLQACLAKEWGSITAEFHLSLMSIKFDLHVSTPSLCQTICCELGHFLLSY